MSHSWIMHWPHEVEIGRDSNESLEEGTGVSQAWMSWSAQVWKSQVLNEADGWKLRKKKPVHHPDSPASCVQFALTLKSGRDLRVEATSDNTH